MLVAHYHPGRSHALPPWPSPVSSCNPAQEEPPRTPTTTFQRELFVDNTSDGMPDDRSSSLNQKIEKPHPARDNTYSDQTRNNTSINPEIKITASISQQHVAGLRELPAFEKIEGGQDGSTS